MRSKCLSIILLLFFSSGMLSAQKKKTTTKKATTSSQVKKKSSTSAPQKKTETVKPAKAEQVKHEQKVRDIVAFLEYVLNILGSKETDAADKDVLVTESYEKIFRDAKVQIEDDLAEKRNVVTNKNVQAYLKDVDFFFTDVKFELHINSVEANENKNGVLFYKVNLTRNLKGTTLDGKVVNNTSPRFIEVNYDPVSQDLKIVSIYTNVVDETQALAQWWNQLSYEWQTLFRKKYNLGDSLTAEDILDITATDSLDLSKNRYLRNFEPLSQLTNLRVVNLSNTNITDLSPFRNLTELVSLNISYTKVADLSSLRYSDKILSLDLDGTSVSDISVLAKMPVLRELEIRSTKVTDLSVLAELNTLQHLSIANNAIADISPLSSHVKMQRLDISQTRVSDITPVMAMVEIKKMELDSTLVKDLKALNGLKSLQELHINYTSINDLTALKDVPSLEKVYCDGTGVDGTKADAFMSSHRGVLVVYNTQDLKSWWDGLPAQWQRALRTAARTGITLSKEDLAKVTNLDSINVADNINIQDLRPLQKIPGLRAIVASKTSVHDLSPLANLRKLAYLDVSQTSVSDFSPIAANALVTIKADQTQLQSLETFSGMETLRNLYVDANNFNDAQVADFLKNHSQCLVVYKGADIQTWWDGLSLDWQEIFKAQTRIRTASIRDDLHRLIERESLHFNDVAVNDLSVLKTFVRLKELHFSGTAIGDLSPLASMKELASLHASNSPVRNLAPLRDIVTLEDIDISNTPVDDITALATLFDLKKFSCAGTQVDDLKPLEKLQKLESLDCSNTNVRKLDAVEGTQLKVLKCYNTKVTDKKVEQFKKLNPQCQLVYYR